MLTTRTREVARILAPIHAQFLHNININMASMSGTNWAAAAAAANNNDEDMPPANENAQPLPSASASRSRPIINPRWMNQHQQSSPTHVNHVNFPPAFPLDDGSWMTPHGQQLQAHPSVPMNGFVTAPRLQPQPHPVHEEHATHVQPMPPALPLDDGSWMTSDGRRQAHPSVPMNVFVPVPRLQQQPHPVHEHATHMLMQPMRNQMITPSPNFGMAYDDDVGFEQHFSAPVYQHPPIPAIHPPYAHGSSSPSLERSPIGKVLFVHNVPSEVAEDELRDLFSRHGTVTRVSILRDTGSIAFVHFKLQSEAEEARLSLNNHRVSKIFGFIIITYASIL